MSLQARVGRHTQVKGHPHCQNWVGDQQTVIGLLNRIPVKQGGAEGSLNGPLIAGLASDALYDAITRFEDKHFPRQRSGFVDPGGAMFQRMEVLAVHASLGPMRGTIKRLDEIEIPPPDFPPVVQALLAQHKIRLPTRARSLSDTEVEIAKKVFAKSLVYEDIYVSNGSGAKDRECTVALEMGRGRWIIVLNLGPHLFRQKEEPHIATLIHELVHAWQSQHHPEEPWRYMVHCVECQIAANIATRGAAATSNKWWRLVQNLSGPAPLNVNLGEASAYAYVPGRSFGDYGGEQIAQQVQDTIRPPAPLSAETKSQIMSIRDRLKGPDPGARDPENIRSLSEVTWAHKSFKNVVWHNNE